MRNYMKKKKINYFIVEVDLYRVDVMVVVGDNSKGFIVNDSCSRGGDLLF